MHFSSTAEYALRTMVHLARLDSSTRTPARELAPEIGVPLPYLAKILRRLAAAGLLTSQKGHGGGFALARPPGAISFAQILRAVDVAPTPEHCLFGWEECDEDNPCPLHPEWSVLKEALSEWAESRTLAGIAAAGPR